MIEILGTVFVASMVGSLHCIGMCGGFVAFYSAPGAAGEPSSSPWPHLAYNGGRLLTYTLLGTLAGGLGAAVNLSDTLTGVHEIAGLVSGTLIVVWGLFLLAQASGAGWARAPLPFGLDRWLVSALPSVAQRPPVVRAALLGTASTLLPCGWLYGFAASAAGTGSMSQGAAVMAVFWLGTVPAMMFAGVTMRAAARILGPRLGLVMPLMLIAMGLATLAYRSGLT